MNETNSTISNTATEVAPAKEKVLANIVRGVIPVALVWAIRFEYKDAKEADVAKKFGTTTGKVADIRKGRNFGYVTEAFKPTQEQKNAALDWLKKVPDYDKVGTDEAVVLIDKLSVASADEAAAFLSGRTASRAKATPATNAAPAAEGSAAPAASKGSKGKGKHEATPASAEDVKSLLS